MQADNEKNEFDVIQRLYAKWLCLPKKIKLSSQDSNQFSELEQKILNINTKKEFSEEFSVSLPTLTSWENSDIVISEKKKWKDMYRKLTPTVTGKLYEKIIEEGDAQRIKLWYQHIEDEKDDNNVNFNFSDIFNNMKQDGDLNEDNRLENKDNR